ncbi:uncharacterized protein CELE_M176.16 [Caenorhabditis elegans]|uniref:Uncharacterized protein n=1 Tax=Caenorhabditis elegans TaxID=6239 RepID=A0A2K5ATR2_CAEEL|nr:Uncharacterized protein CELE_M176.16 [Caenorhabditis elegans]SPC47301.1 Uncharacterized protein CELE_M176.16 [Caenorhabditis elegans]|eukprot:NP_001348714.1 Uncharacterized protein CELE_M176.16 [Caenorhabditis elegans]
MGGSVLSPEK